MRPHERGYLDTVVRFVTLDDQDRPLCTGAGVLCRFRDTFKEREFFFLVTTAHLIGSDCDLVVVIFPPREGAEPVLYAVTAETGRGPETWSMDRRRDIAALMLEPARIPADRTRVRYFDVKDHTLSVRELRKRGIEPGAQGLRVGFVGLPDDSHWECPVVRPVTVTEIPRHGWSLKPLLVEGTGFPGDSGSPVILKPGRDPGLPPDSAAGARLIGLTEAIGWPRLPASDAGTAPLRITEAPTTVRLVPVDALRDVLQAAVGRMMVAETFGPLLRKVRGWFGRRE